ncbi:hypothetical protein [Pollutimonas bauzanensis]|nr:hypothetical protein [Pollutimonas bauzanensis]
MLNDSDGLYLRVSKDEQGGSYDRAIFPALRKEMAQQGADS